MAVLTLETDDPSETVNPSSKPVSDGPSVSSVNMANGCDTRTKLSWKLWIFLSAAFATVGNWFLSAVFTLEMFRL